MGVPPRKKMIKRVKRAVNPSAPIVGGKKKILVKRKIIKKPAAPVQASHQRAAPQVAQVPNVNQQQMVQAPISQNNKPLQAPQQPTAQMQAPIQPQVRMPKQPIVRKAPPIPVRKSPVAPRKSPVKAQRPQTLQPVRPVASNVGQQTVEPPVQNIELQQQEYVEQASYQVQEPQVSYEQEYQEEFVQDIPVFEEVDYEQEEIFETSYEQSQGDDLFEIQEDVSSYENEYEELIEEINDFEEPVEESSGLLEHKDDVIYVPKLKKEEKNLYFAYRNFLQAAFYAAEIGGYEPLQPRLKAKNMGPKLKDETIKTLQEDMINAWSVLSAIYPYELGGLSGNENDNELLSIAERSDDVYLQDAIFSHIEVMIELEACEIREEALGLRKEKQKIVDEYNEMKYKNDKVIETYVTLLEKEKFPINARKLITNYLRAASKDPEKAFETLTTNPAMFSRIEIENMPKKLFGLLKPSPSDAKKINKKIAKFLKKVKP
jgi:hypothetical protein